MFQTTLSRELRLRLEHGGSLGKGKRKERRPVVTKRAMHIVFRVAEGGPNLTQHAKLIHGVVSRFSHRFGVETYERAICGNHVHLAVRAKTKQGFSNFLRAVSGTIALKLKGGRKLWESIPWTRIVEWGRHFKRLLSYVRQNELEARGILKYQPRNSLKKRMSTPAPFYRLGNGLRAGGHE